MRKEDIIMFVSQVVENHGFFVVEVKITPQGKLLIFMDGLAQKVTIDDCVKVSRTILEQHEEIAEQYGIEVSSPGLENPFKVQEQYTKNIGNLVSVLLKDGKKISGKLIEHDTEKLFLEETRIRKEKKKKIKEKILHKLFFTQIKSTKQII